MARKNEDPARCSTAAGPEMFFAGGWNNSQRTPSTTKRQRFCARSWIWCEPLSANDLSHLPPRSGEPDTFVSIGPALCAALARLAAIGSDHDNYGRRK